MGAKAKNMLQNRIHAGGILKAGNPNLRLRVKPYKTLKPKTLKPEFWAYGFAFRVSRLWVVVFAASKARKLAGAHWFGG